MSCQLISSETLTERWWCAKGFCCKVFLSVAAAACSQLLCELLGKYLLISELHNAHIVRQVFFRLQFLAAESWMAVWVLRGSLFRQFLRMTFSWRHISHLRVAMHLRCGGIFNHHFNANLSHSLTMKEFWKSVKIWQSYWHKFITTFFCETQCIMGFLCIVCLVRVYKRWISVWFVSLSAHLQYRGKIVKLLMMMLI